MNQLINSPIEIPNVNEEVKKKPEIKEGMYKEISTTREEIREQFKWLPDVKVDIFDNRIPKLTLTWKRNVKKLRNWMVKHMEAYPITKYGFLVNFSNDTSNKLFIVRPCHDDEDPNITINWVDYRIIEKTLKIDPIEEISESTKLELIEALLYPTADE